MSSPDWWSQQKPEFKFLTTDKYGMTAIHTTRPTFNGKAGKWFPTGTGRRQDLGLREIDGVFNAESSLDIRPGAESEPAQPTQMAERAAPTPPPQNVGDVTPSQHLVDLPRGDSLTQINPPPATITSVTVSHPDGPSVIVQPVELPVGPIFIPHCQIVNRDPRVDAILATAKVIDVILERLAITGFPMAESAGELKKAIANLEGFRAKGML